MSDSDLFRVYRPDECDEDGYPLAWHGLGDNDLFAIKNLVRTEAGNRCVRCGHPYEKGMGEWSRCDEQCTHLGPVRMREIYRGDGEWTEYDEIPELDLFDYGPGGERIQRWDAEARWRILTVHHLNNVKADCRWWNLAALCQRCHLQIQGKVNMERVWPWEHSPWFRPYVAAFYARSYLGEDLTRAETLARLDELLDLERMVR